ncbi:hypothetical protein DEO72_LG10g1223 [Vigna unguiculata]|uniref:Uncharacterized protein n=1 Tax=Vigna unguiculata TaxID=3917 RepID=A0A4D6N844_VIGUN|nr:hypothetical protein DEO72_LG10g1223 [Vigna unguiculata]
MRKDDQIDLVAAAAAPSINGDSCNIDSHGNIDDDFSHLTIATFTSRSNNFCISHNLSL